MKRSLMIFGSVLVVGCAGAGAVWLLRPGLIPWRSDHPAEVKAQVSASDLAAAQQINDRLKAKLRELGAAQDRSVYGDGSASDDQYRLVGEIASDYDDIDFAKTPVAPDFDSILVYVLSGGEPDVLQSFIDGAPAPENQKQLAKGVLSFLNGDSKDGLAHLRNVEPLTLAPQLIGPMALAKASLEASSDVQRALDFLDIARLASPHTAVEEAAMRREILLLLRHKDMDRALSLVSDYLRRFTNSAYRPGFVADFAESVAVNDASDGQKFVADLLAAIEELETGAKSQALLALSESYLKKGKLAAAKAAASACLEAKQTDETVKARAKLYAAAADAPTVQAAASKQILSEMQSVPVELSEDDTRLRDAAAEIANGVLAGADDQNPRDVDDKKAVPGPGSSEDVADGAIKPMLNRVSEMLRATDQLAGEVP